MRIEVQDLSVRFGSTAALEGVTLRVGEGVFGLLGENGAGKTTLMRVLTTLLTPTKGNVKINGLELTSANYEKIRRNIGYLPQELGLYPHLSVRESLAYMADLSGLDKKIAKERIDFYLDKTNLMQVQNKKTKQLSGGMKRRVGLIQAMLHEPQVLIVDEPTTGLDPEERIRIRNLLVDFSAGRTILFSTHTVEDLTATCTQVAILKKGQIIYDGEIRALMQRAHNQIWLCLVDTPEQMEQIEANYTVTSRQYRDQQMELRIISPWQPHVPCEKAAVTLEDAYLYLNNGSN
ncbi:MAG: ABC transporter ATP-binding protein [Clostridium sp.]|jgi:ABC-type multidrug transport system ATPase subunit|nr:ABC transporter ATP-binding protein [Clostridium sp.]